MRSLVAPCEDFADAAFLDVDGDGLDLTLEFFTITELGHVYVEYSGVATNNFDGTSEDFFPTFLINLTGEIPTITVQSSLAFEEGQLSCGTNSNITLSTDCEAVILPSMLLNGNSLCPAVENSVEMTAKLIEAAHVADPMQADVAGTGSISVSTPGLYKYTIALGDDECWGYFTVEDKSAPICAPAGDKEPDTYVCDSEEKVEDPSGVDDLATEYVSHVVIDMYGKPGIEPWFDVLEQDDFQDCSDMANVEYTTTVEDFCDGGYDDPEVEASFPGWEVCQIFTRTWTAYDWKGNEISNGEGCSQLVKVLRPTQIELDEYATGECGHDEVGALYPYFMDLPAGYTCPQTAGTKIILEPGKTICKWNANVELGNEIELCTDPSLADCSDAFKQVNEWTIIDLCSYDEDVRDQVYLFEDTHGPALDIDEVSVWTNAFDCTTSMTASFSADDYCSAVIGGSISATYQIVDAHGNVVQTVKETAEGYSITLNDVPLEVEVTFTISAWDCCGNMTSEDVTANSWDNRAPVCVANDELEIGLIPTDHDDNGNGVIDPSEHSVGARVYPEDLDDTSKDNCFPLKMEIRKVYADGTLGDWSPYVEYSYDSEDDFNGDKCTDVQWVDLRVTEIRKDGSYGLSTVCQSKLTLRDSNAPKFDALADKVQDCFAHDYEFDTPFAWGFCLDISYEDDIKEYHCPTYLEGVAPNVLKSHTRTWTVTKMTEHAMYSDEVSQTIYVTEVRDEKFTFPLDIKVECSDEGEVPGIPAPLKIHDILENNGCSEWVMDVEDQEFLGDADACFKILRKYTFINWCDWDENNVSPNFLAVDKDQFDLDGDGKLLTADETAMITYEDHPADEGYFTYTQVIKIADNTNPEGDIEAKVSCDPSIDGCHQGIVEFTIEFSDKCSTPSITDWYVEHDADYGDELSEKFTRDGNVVYAKGLPTANYTIHVRVDDKCGNFVWISETAELEKSDCKKPTVIGLANFTALMENCTVDVWLSDILTSSDDNCLAYGALTFGMELANDGIASDIMPTAQSVTIDAAGVNTIALWAKDYAGNTQYTFVPVNAQDNAGNCATIGGADEAAVVGNITNENDEMIDNVVVSAKGSNMVDFTSIFNGSFAVASVPMNSDVTISAEKNVGHLNGVSTADLVLLQRHVLGIAPLSSAYKLIAADANNDESIDTRDMLHISRLVLGIYDELPNNSSWRFVDKAHTFANPTSPWGFPEAIDFTSLSADAQADFIGVKVGDLSGNATPSNLLGSDDTKVGAMSIAIEDATIAAGETQTIEFTTANFNNFAGYQFSIALDSRVSFNGISAGDLDGVSEANFGLANLESGIITTNWSDVEGVSVENGTVMFSLTVTATETVNVSEILTVNSAVTSAEAYNSDLEVYTVGVQFNRAASANFELFQNIPNPVSGETVIGFNLPTAGAATLKVMDVAGRTLHTVSNTFAAGFNTISLEKSDLNATGVLYYTLDTDNNSATKKMVILE